MYNLVFFTNVLRLLSDENITKNELAERAGISVSFLSDLTNGKANPSLKVMEAIAGALAVPLPTLLEMTDLDRASLDELMEYKGATETSVRFVRVSALLTEYQAFTVQQWDAANRAQLIKPPHPDSSSNTE